MWHIWGTEEVYAGFWWINLRLKVHLEDPGNDGGLILRWIFWKWDGLGFELESSGSGLRLVVGICECSNKNKVSIKFGNFLDG
jgi:hypothetical protein